MCMCICVQKVRIYSSSISNTLSRGAGWDCLRRRRQQLNMSMRTILKCAFISFVNKPHTPYYNTMTHVSIGRMIGWGSLVLLTLIGRLILSIHMYVLLVLETTRRIFLSNASSSSHVFTPNSFSHSIRSLSLYLSIEDVTFEIHISTSHFQWVSMAFSWNLNVVDARTFETTKTTNRFFIISFRSQLYSFYLFVCFEWIKIYSFESRFFFFFFFSSFRRRFSFWWIHSVCASVSCRIVVQFRSWLRLRVLYLNA